VRASLRATCDTVVLVGATSSYTLHTLHQDYGFDAVRHGDRTLGRNEIDAVLDAVHRSSDWRATLLHGGVIYGFAA
jgi:hypothetical protein